MGFSDGWIKPKLRFPTMVLAGPETLQTSGTVDKSSQVESKLTHLHVCLFIIAVRISHRVYVSQEITMENGKQPTVSRAWVTSAR